MLRFIVDNNVGRLAVWLRALGYDALFINPIDDGDLVRIAADEGRVILTKDTGVMERRIVVSGEARAYLVKSGAWEAQLREICAEFALGDEKEFSRCLVCNSAVQLVDRDRINDSAPDQAGFRDEHLIPADVLAEETQFAFCGQCDRYYWKGSHWKRMKKVLARALDAKTGES